LQSWHSTTWAAPPVHQCWLVSVFKWKIKTDSKDTAQNPEGGTRSHEGQFPASLNTIEENRDVNLAGLCMPPVSSLSMAVSRTVCLCLSHHWKLGMWGE
jgi:hypothetical protein